ncbi:MAG: autotransporter-associated beta strand repeat-containing protein, partial [Vicinamibacterales bacterium]|nr:autotransporter-associated beta strand repeat-containing protein [Vicinamibacterales bacterium]
MPTSSTRRVLFALLVVLVFARPGFSQQTLTWDANGATAGTGGTGTWNTTLVLWDNGGVLQTWNNAGGDNAVFGGTAGTVTLGVPITAHNLNFLLGGYTVTGSTLTLGGATPTITLTAGTTTIASAVAGTAGLTVAGTGTVILSNAANTYTGTTTINGGTLQISAANRLPTTTNIVLGNVAGATLNLNGFAQTVASLSGGGASGGAVTLGAGTLTVSPAGSTEFAGTISGTGGLAKGGAGTQVLSGTNTYSGTTTVSAGVLQVGNGGTTGTLGTGGVTNNAAVRMNRSDTLTVSNLISGTGTVTQAGLGTTVL